MIKYLIVCQVMVNNWLFQLFWRLLGSMLGHSKGSNGLAESIFSLRNEIGSIGSFDNYILWLTIMARPLSKHLMIWPNTWEERIHVLYDDVSVKGANASSWKSNLVYWQKIILSLTSSVLWIFKNSIYYTYYLLVNVITFINSLHL